MIQNAIGLLLLFISLLALALQRLYSSVPARELKRLTVKGDQLAATLYRAAAYGTSLRLLLWTIMGLAFSGGLLVLIPRLQPVLAFVMVTVLLMAAFVWLPSLRLTKRSALVAAWLAPPVAWLLLRLHPLLQRMSDSITEHRAVEWHSRLYEKEDLLALLGQQKEQADNRILAHELELAERTLAFTDKRAVDIVQPRSQAHLVNADDSIGPVLLDTLHKQKQNSFLVYKDTKENIIGWLAMSDAITAKEGGRVFDLIRGDLTFVHEDFTLPEVLSVFQKTGQQVVLVINEFEEFLGPLTLNDLLLSLLGTGASLEEINYGNRSLVAAYASRQADTNQDVTETSIEEVPDTVASSPEATEVVE